MRELCRFNVQFLRQLAAAQNLKAVLFNLADDARFLEQFSRHYGTVLQTVEVGNVDNRVFFSKDVGKAPLRQTAWQRHLAAFKTVLLASAARFLALVTHR
ncbi:hypothetical protein SDC9_90104 [bioreactor metagenome]|uniref:Uncharacterized protein n=1 Tax=bioreactor metagenome TaxID=1076179 RepID=A0A644ZR26_9ZZZZ